jgi:hypothetical protein
MTDTDCMGELQAAAHSLRDLASVEPDSRPPLEEITENFRSARIAIQSLGVLLHNLGVQLGDFLNDHDGYASRVKNPADAANQITAAHAVTANVVGAVPSIVGALHAAETALVRIEPAGGQE